MTFEIRKSQFGEYYLCDWRTMTRYSYNGTPVHMTGIEHFWQIVGFASSVFAWQHGEIDYNH